MKRLAYVLSVLVLITIARQFWDSEILCLDTEEGCSTESSVKDDELYEPLPDYPSDSFIDEDDEPITA